MTYAELKTLIQDYCQNTETVFVSHLDDFIKQAEAKIFQSALLKDGYQTATGTLSAATLAAPAGFLHPRSFRITVAGVDKTLREKDESFIREVWPNATTTGVPKYYAIKDDATLIFAPTPVTSYTYTFHYYGIGATIISATTTNTSWLSTYAPSVLLYACLIEAYTFMKGSEDLIALYTRLYNESLAALKIEMEGQASSDSNEKGLQRD